MTNTPIEMTAIMAIKAGGPDVLQSKVVPTPEPGPHEVLIKVHAAGVNRPDAKQRAGDYPPPPGVTDILGLEVAGIIVDIGEAVDPSNLGRKVCALVAGGGYAEFVVAPLPQVLPIPEGLSMIEAAAVPETTFTVWTNMVRIGRLKRGESILIHGGTSGIGTTAIQIAKALGASVYVTAGSDDKAKKCLDLGADAAINYRTADFAKRVLELTDGRGVDAILDIVCGDYLTRNLSCLAEDGRLIVISFLGGGTAEVDFKKLARNRHTICGSTLRPQSVSQKQAIAEEILEEVWPMITAGLYRPLIHSMHDLNDACVAHQEMEDGNHMGKIVLTLVS